MKFLVELNYEARIIQEVEASDEGEALDKARTLAEEADMSDFVHTQELNSKILSRE